MTTEKKVVANRKNSQKSTGPKSPGGKRRSSLNALKLGAFAKTSLLPTEDPGEFSALARGIYSDWNPIGTTERTLVELLVSTLWRSLRLNTVEMGLFQMYRTYKDTDGGVAT